MNLFDCEGCGGVGKMTTIISKFKHGETVETVVNMNCYHCDGKGKVDEKKNEFFINYRKLWCKCEEEHDTHFYDNYEHPELDKHHYRCSNCEKVVQIG